MEDCGDQLDRTQVKISRFILGEHGQMPIRRGRNAPVTVMKLELF